MNIKGNKYNNRFTYVDGIKFDSKKEAERYKILKQKESDNLISNLELQPTYKFELNGILICKYKADFRYYDYETSKTIIEDVKGVRTEKYLLKKKLMKAFYSIDIEEI